MTKRTFIRWIGAGLPVVGTAVLLYPLFLLAYSHIMSSILLHQAQHIISDANTTEPNYLPVQKSDSIHQPNRQPNTRISGLYPVPAPALSRIPEKGKVIGELSIPELHLNEPILEGTDQPELAKAPGHLPSSVMPGQIGKSIIAAHNVTTFHQIDSLKPGTKILVTTEQGTFTFSVMNQRILHVNDPLPNTAYPALDLETCYPLNAWHLTDQRLFVEAALVKSIPNSSH
ncbi:class D sortase [Fodinisporobacter ferrooxydans]|uniref:Class D sortase n=1 Tax=Fodinisporobacter ferrooxydans TaxID=2901836 RepID=A0ABY4CGM9_9BACL|nr:class D sortase [Alicyclobacillaceae bacterium MYW30-H2]